MASCEAKTHNVLYGANMTKLFAFYIVTNKTQLYVFAVSLHVVPAAKIQKPGTTRGLEPLTSNAGVACEPLS